MHEVPQIATFTDEDAAHTDSDTKDPQSDAPLPPSPPPHITTRQWRFIPRLATNPSSSLATDAAHSVLPPSPPSAVAALALVGSR